MKTYFSQFIILISSIVFSQMYIGNDPDFLNNLQTEYNGTTVPSLIVDENVLIKGKLIFKEGGHEGQVLRSNGPNEEPSWQTIVGQMHRLRNLNYLLYSQTFDNLTGIDLPTSTNNSSKIYNLDEAMDTDNTQGTSDWRVITGARNPEFTIAQNNPSVYITFESVAHIEGSGSDTGTMFACGIFVAEKQGLTNPTRDKFKLKGVRIFTANRGTNSDPFFNIRVSTAVNNLEKGKTYQVNVACKRRGNYGVISAPELSIGKKSTGTNINDETARTFLKISRYEKTVKP